MASSVSWRTCQMVFAFFIITGMVAFVSEPYPGARHDFIIFRESVAKYREFLEKRVDEEDFDDPEQSQAHWALLADKGYTGAEAYLRALIPKKPTTLRALTAQEIAYNERLSSARVICENFYGRMKGLFKICSDRFKGKGRFY